ncbi:MFS transporter [Natrinema thermotolerans]|uniref:MFS transporter n=1 Tax=Natrinema thermotolerans TaxID=121872 RepID=A0AAF0P8H1_9EURY|nr:MFS transporter [Natrinema thermotolerans]QCC59474.1 MFS transporter [Natrinema thermotolerans]WMT06447.1 MFS transporter [Natrinema thermotolerans]
MSRVRGGRSVAIAYYLYRMADSVGFIWPVFTLFLLWNGLTYVQIGTLSAMSAVLVVSLEVPTGYVADRYGRRLVLGVGMLAMAASTAGFVVADAFLEFAVLYALWALSMALQSGTADAWLYDALGGDRAENEPSESRRFTRVRGRGGAVHQWTSAVTMIGGGFLYVVHPTAPFVASALLNAVGVLVVVAMPRNAQFEGAAANSGKTDERLGIFESLSVLAARLAAPSIRAVVAYAALFFGIVHAADTYVQPITVDVLRAQVGGALENVSVAGIAIRSAALLGFVYAGFAAVAAVGSYYAEAVRRRVGLRHALRWLPVCVAASFLLPLAVPLLSVPVFFGMKGGEALSKPLVAQFLNDRIPDAGRATVLSGVSMGNALVRAPLLPLAGVVADRAAPTGAVAALGGGFLAVAAVGYLLASPLADAAPRAPSEG